MINNHADRLFDRSPVGMTDGMYRFNRNQGYNRPIVSNLYILVFHTNRRSIKNMIGVVWAFRSLPLRMIKKHFGLFFISFFDKKGISVFCYKKEKNRFHINCFYLFHLKEKKHIRGLPLITYAPWVGGVSSLLYISIAYYMQKGGGGGPDSM